MSETDKMLDRTSWPKDGPYSNGMARESDLAGFIALLEMCQGPLRMWTHDFRLKYLEVVIDTRCRSFILKDRDGNRIDPMDVVKATRLTLEAYSA